MKKGIKRSRGLIKGTSPAVLMSALFHGALLLIAGGLVVFNIIKKEETQFVPHKVERPKMQLKKLRVKVKQTAKQRKTTERITSARRSNTMPDIQLPRMGGMGAGLDEGIGGFQMVSDLSQMTLMGSGRSVGNDFEGTYYYLMQKRSGAKYPGMSGEEGANAHGTGLCAQFLSKFLRSGWDISVFDPFWRAPAKLYATQFFVPPVNSSLAPEKFGDNTLNEAAYWFAHYKGEIGHKTGGRFRFWGHGDDVLFVRINGEIVLDGCWQTHYEADMAGWRPEPEAEEVNRRYTLANTRFRVGNWFELDPGIPLEMEVLLGEIPGGGFSAMLCVEQEGVDYPERDIPGGGPLLPIFRTMETPEHIIDEMSYAMPDGQVDFFGGSIFSAY